MSDPFDVLRDTNPVSEQEGQEWASGSAGLAVRDAATRGDGMVLMETEPTSNPTRSRMLAAAAVLLVVLASGDFLALRTTKNNTAVVTGSEPTTTSNPDNEEQPVPPEEPTFDPALAALGVTTPEEIAELQAAEKSFASEADSEAIAASNAWGEAIDDLYDRVSKRPGSAAMREQWVQCAADAGYDVSSPMELNDLTEGLSGAEFDAVIEVGEKCDREQAADLSAAVEAEFPAWQADHEQIIADYRAALGLQ